MDKLNLYQKINQVMKEVETVVKDKTISYAGQSFKVVTHDMVTSALHEPCARIGIVLIPSVVERSVERFEGLDKYGKQKIEYMASVVIELMAINSDKPDERLSIKMPAFAFDSGDKAFGKAISFATKYAYLKLFMLESIDEEEAIRESIKDNIVDNILNKNKDLMRYKIKVGTHAGKFLKDVPKNDLKSMIETLEPKISTLGSDWVEYVNNAKELLKNETNK